MATRYIIIDRANKVLRYFTSYKEALNFKILNDRYDWTIKHYENESTSKQVEAVHFCEIILNVQFTGDITNKNECSKFLTKYLIKAKYEYSRNLVLLTIMLTFFIPH